jgi:hypothetical protein
MGLESGDLFFELIDPLFDGSQSQFSNMFIAGRAITGFRVELLQLRELGASILQLLLILDAHDTTSIIPLAYPVRGHFSITVIVFESVSIASSILLQINGDNNRWNT